MQFEEGLVLVFERFKILQDIKREILVGQGNVTPKVNSDFPITETAFPFRRCCVILIRHLQPNGRLFRDQILETSILSSMRKVFGFRMMVTEELPNRVKLIDKMVRSSHVLLRHQRNVNDNFLELSSPLFYEAQLALVQTKLDAVTSHFDKLEKCIKVRIDDDLNCGDNDCCTCP